MAGNPAFHMIPINVTPPATSVNGADWTTAEVDTVNATYGKAQYTNFYVYTGAVGAADITVLKIQECDTSGGTFADITGASFTTPPANADDNEFWLITINNSPARKRYYELVMTSGASASFAVAFAFNCFPSIQPITAAGLGLGGLASV